MNFTELQQQALAIAKKYKEKNKADGHKEWDASAYMAGFVGDVGDLSKLVMAKQGFRDSADVDGALAHELADCLWSLLVLSNELDIDIEAAFQKTLQELHNRLAA